MMASLVFVGGRGTRWGGSEVAYEEASAAKREVLALLYRHFFDQIRNLKV